MHWRWTPCLALLAFLPLVASASGASRSAAVPVFGRARAIVPFTADDVGAATETESGDLNGDGLADVVVTRITYPPARITHPIGIFLADGHGSLTDGSSMWDGPPAQTEWGRQILIADFNGDHRNDIFVADTGYDAEPFPGHQNELALSTPQGKLVDATANLPPESGYTHSAAAADVNGDGSVDLYIGNTFDAPVEILVNDGTGHFTRLDGALPRETAFNHGAYLRSLLLDVNGDGSPDLVLGADGPNPDSTVLLNDGTGHFHEAPAPSFPPKPEAFGPTGILIGLASLDINHDGRPDLLAGFTSYNPFYVGRRLQVLINNGDGTFRDETAQRLPEQDSGEGWPYAIRVADFNGDGLPDFTVDVNHFPIENAPIYVDDGNGVYREVPFAAPAQLFAIVDANGDGHPDVFSTFSGGGGGPERHFLQLEIVAPAAPRNLRAIGRHDGIHLTWSHVSGATGYEVWRSAGAGVRRKIGFAALGERYVDPAARRKLAYTYSIRATNDAGPGPFSSTVRAKRP
jgi:hypothetical protein